MNLQHLFATSSKSTNFTKPYPT